MKAEFDQLFEESAHKRRQMSISFHDRIGGSPQMIKTTGELIGYMQKNKGVVFKKKE